MSTLEFYAERAAQCRSEADAAALPNVRDRCLGAAEAWENMASRARKLQGFRADRAAEKAALDVEDFPETAILA
ncbi:MAG: hypothetical protein ABIT69_04930 [Sphingomicrobium sp.]